MADQNGKLTDGIFPVVGGYYGAPVVLLLDHVLHDSGLLTFNCATIVFLCPFLLLELRAVSCMYIPILTLFLLKNISHTNGTE